MPGMTGARFFAEAVQACGIDTVFFVPTVLTPALAEMERMGLRCVMAHAEKAAVYKADGYARASHRPGICMAQAIGAANLAAGLRDPYLACTPVVAITGGSVPESRYRYVYQEIDDFSLFEPLTKFNARIDTVQRLPDLLRQAFRSATTGCPAPVHLEIAGHFGQAIDVEADLDPVFEATFSHYPPFRHPGRTRTGGGGRPLPGHCRASCHCCGGRCHRLFRQEGGGRARGNARHSRGYFLKCERDHSGKPPSLRGCGRSLFPRLRQPGCGRSRPGLLYRQPHREPGYE